MNLKIENFQTNYHSEIIKSTLKSTQSFCQSELGQRSQGQLKLEPEME